MRKPPLAFAFAALAALGLIAAASCRKGATTPSGGLVFSGTVSQGGQKVAGVSVFLSWDDSRAVVTDAAGGFRFESPSGSRFVITPARPATRFSPSNAELGAQSRTDLAFEVAAPAFGSKVGDMAADFSLLNQGGTTVSLSQFHGSVVLLDFSADWCGPCRAEAAKLQAIYDQYKDRGLVILTLMIDGSAADWAAQYGLTFPVLNDNAKTQWRIYGEGYVPLNMVLDRNGTIRRKVGNEGFNEAALIEDIKKYL